MINRHITFHKITGIVFFILIVGFLTTGVSWSGQDDNIIKDSKEKELSPAAPAPEPGPEPKPAVIETEKNKSLPAGRQAGPASQVTLKQENEQLRKQMTSLEDKSRKDKAALYQELGNAYTEMKLYDSAIDAYQQALIFDPDIADVYYRLGLLYKHSRNDAKKGIEYLKKYLKLNPEAKDRKQIEYLIDMLAQAEFPFTDDLKKGWEKSK